MTGHEPALLRQTLEESVRATLVARRRVAAAAFTVFVARAATRIVAQAHTI